ncbi:MAG TPA: hypothetical protein VN911_13025 [Candidatus Acidoferrum sp.]|nr:hypothetical protein [Candidatus Acidoferrum sp.]
MSTSTVSSSSLYSQLGQYFQTRQSDLKQLGQALQSGDLAGAQTAYNNIASLGQNGPFAGGNPFRANQTDQKFANLGQALQSGDLAGAQQAFASLGSAGGRGNRQLDPLPSTGPTPASSIGPEIIINLSPATTGNVSPLPTATTPTPAASNGPEIILNLGPISSGSGGSASPEQITISLSSPAGGGEQVSIGIGSQGSTAEQLTFNLPKNSNEQIILNLLEAASSTGSSSSGTTNGSPASGGLNVSA